MKFISENNVVVIHVAPEDAGSLVNSLLDQKEHWFGSNVILDVSHLEFLVDNLVIMLRPTIHSHKDNANSFVVVDKVARLTQYQEFVTVAPTIQEAHDLIEMEQIERDLGF